MDRMKRVAGGANRFTQVFEGARRRFHVSMRAAVAHL